MIWLIPPASFVLWTTVLVSPVGWKWLWQCCHSHHMRLRKWLWSFRDRFFSRFRLAPAVSWFCRFFWKIEITKQRHANSGRFQCLRTTKKINYINHTTKKIAFLWFPRCSFLLFNRIRMSNLNFRVIPVFFVIFSVWKHHFSTTKKKHFGCGEDDKDEENLTELLSCTLQVDIHQIQPAKKNVVQRTTTWCRVFTTIRQDFLGPVCYVETCLLKKKRENRHLLQGFSTIWVALRIMGSQHVMVWRSQNTAIQSQTPLYRRVQWLLRWLVDFQWRLMFGFEAWSRGSCFSNLSKTKRA